MKSPAQLVEWLAQIRALTGWSNAVLARHAGLSPSTISRFDNDPEGHFLSGRSQAKIHAAVRDAGFMIAEGDMDAVSIRDQAWTVIGELLAGLVENDLADLDETDIDNLSFKTAQELLMRLDGEPKPLADDVAEIAQMHHLRRKRGAKTT